MVARYHDFIIHVICVIISWQMMLLRLVSITYVLHNEESFGGTNQVTKNVMDFNFFCANWKQWGERPPKAANWMLICKYNFLKTVKKF